MEKKREPFDFAADLAALRPQLMRRAELRWPKRYWRYHSPEDLASETICRAFANQEAFRGTSVAELAKYAQRILDNLIFNVRREIEAQHLVHEPFQPSKHLPPSSGTTPSGKLIRKEAAAEVASALGSLPSDQRLVCQLVDMSDTPYEQASQAMRAPEYKLYRLIRKARSVLRRRLAPHGSHT